MRPCDEAGCHQPGKWWVSWAPLGSSSATGFLCEAHYQEWWTMQQDAGLLCGQWWPDGDSWKPCRNAPDGEKAALCQFHGAMADAAQRAFWKSLKTGSQATNSGTGGYSQSGRTAHRDQ